MAEQVNIEFNLNTSKSNKSVQQLQKEIRDLNKTLRDTKVGSDEFKKLNSELVKSRVELKQAKKDFQNLEFKFELDTAESENSIASLQNRIKSLTLEIEQVDVGSDEFKRLSKEIANANIELKGAKEELRGLDFGAALGEIGKLTGGVAAGFTAVTAVIGNGNEEFEKFASNVITGMSVAQGLKGSLEAVDAAQKMLNLTMEANPLYAVVAAVAALTAGLIILYNVLQDNTTAAERHAEIIGKNTEEYKNFEDSVKNASQALRDAQIELSELDGTYEGIILTIKNVTDAQNEQITNLRENARERIKILEEQIKDEEDNYEVRIQLEEELNRVKRKLAKAETDVRETTNLQLTKLQKNLNKELEDADEERYEFIKEQQTRIINLIRETNNEILRIDLDTYSILNSSRSGLVDYEIELLERSARIDKKIRREQFEEEVKENKEIIKQIKENADERIKAARNAAIAEAESAKSSAESLRKQVDEKLDIELEALRKQEADGEISYTQRQDKERELRTSLSKEWDKYNNDFIKANKDLQEAKAKTDEEYDKENLNRIDKLNKEIAERQKSLADLELSITENLEAKKVEIRKKFNKEQYDLFLESQKRITLIELEREYTQLSNIEDISELRRKLFESDFEFYRQETYKVLQPLPMSSSIRMMTNEEKERFKKASKKERQEILDSLVTESPEVWTYHLEPIRDLMDFEEELANKRQKMAEDEEVRTLNLQLTRLKSIKTISDEELKGMKDRGEISNEEYELNVEVNKRIADSKKTLEDEITAVKERGEAERDDITRQYEIKRAEREKTILRNQIDALQSNLEKEFRLREGNLMRISELTKRQLDSEKTIELMNLEEKYKQDILLAHFNVEKQKEITAEYEEAKRLIEEDYRKKKIKAEIDAYMQIFRAGEELLNTYAEVSANQQQAILEDRKSKMDEYYSSETAALSEAKESGLITEKQYEDEVKRLQDEKEQRTKKLEYDQAVRERQMAKTKSAIETALNVIEAFPNPLQMALATATGISQQAIINSQPLPQLEKGGLLKGKRHNAGGIVVEAEDGEIILNRNVSKNPYMLQMASMMNEATGGKKLTNTPMITNNNNVMNESINIKEVVKEVVDGVTSIPVKNVATDTDKMARKVKNIETSSKL